MPDVSGEIVFYTAGKRVKMSGTKSKTAYVLTSLIAILSLAVAAGGLFSTVRFTGTTSWSLLTGAVTTWSRYSLPFRCWWFQWF